MEEVKMIQNEMMELVFILDRSGSMGGLENETIQGFNRVVEQQKEMGENVLVTTILFDDQYQVLYQRALINTIQPLTRKQYFVRGVTALFDAIGKTITTIHQEQTQSKINMPIVTKTMVVIITDGLENASQEYNLTQVRSLIQHHQQTNQWEFLFLGAHIDSLKEAQDMGVNPRCIRKFDATTQGIEICYSMISDEIKQKRKDNKKR